MSILKKIEPQLYATRLELPPAKFGTRPDLKWLRVSDLRIDSSYQRIIAERGITSVRRIATEFEWSKFAPVIVAPVQGGVYAIIDGQHRTTAAAIRGIVEVPCQIVKIERAAQAAAFAAINAQVTAITPMQLYAARLAAGDQDARELSKICERAGISICKYPVPASQIKVGETMAVHALARLLKRFGADVLVTALACITQTRKGNPGMLRRHVLDAMCSVLDAEPQFAQSEKKLLAAMQRFDFYAAWTAAGQKSFSERCSVASALVDAIADHLDKQLGAEAA